MFFLISFPEGGAMIEGHLLFWFSRHPVELKLNVRVERSPYGKRIFTISDLERHLKEKITFEYEIDGEPVVQILKPQSIEMAITPSIPIEEAVATLRANGFSKERESLAELTRKEEL
jgi:hypothetical protein